MKSGTPDGNMVADMIKQGQIVPSRVCCPIPLFRFNNMHLHVVQGWDTNATLTPFDLAGHNQSAGRGHAERGKTAGPHRWIPTE
jgi:hypothetical protein